jgi:hypothetical protein
MKNFVLNESFHFKNIPQAVKYGITLILNAHDTIKGHVCLLLYLFRSSVYLLKSWMCSYELVLLFQMTEKPGRTQTVNGM